MGSKEDNKSKLYCGRELRTWSCCGPCMISFGIPLLIPGITLTCVALSSNTGVEAFTGLHVTGFVFLGIGIFMICLGCVVYNVFRVKVGPAPIVLLSHTDLRMTHSQRLYYRNRPTFEIRSNSAKPSTCFRIESETKPPKSKIHTTEKVSKLPEKFNRQGEDVSATNSKPITSSTNSKPDSSNSQTESESSDGTTSESDSDDYTSSSYTSSCTGTETSASQSTLERLQKSQVKHIPVKNITVATVTDSAMKDEGSQSSAGQNPSLKGSSGKYTQRESLTHDSDSQTGNLTGVGDVTTLGSYSACRERPTEDVKSEVFKPSSANTAAWQMADSEINGSSPITCTPRPQRFGQTVANDHLNSVPKHRSDSEDADVSESYSDDVSTPTEPKMNVHSSDKVLLRSLSGPQSSSEQE